MNWYLIVEGKQRGPVSPTALQELERTGALSPDTLVWRQGLDGWQPYSTVTSPAAPPPLLPGNIAAAAPAAGMAVCLQCGVARPEAQVFQFNDLTFCAPCKPVIVKKLQEGVPLPGEQIYGGFWMRFLAKFIDGIIMYAVNMIISFGMMFFMIFVPDIMALQLILTVGQVFVQLGAAAAYHIWFIGRFAATPGKMICRLKVVRADGSRVTYWLAAGRTFAEYLSYFTMYIGYIIAAFDEEKRALHDHICDTRVLKK